MFKNIYSNSFLNKMKKMCNIRVLPTNLIHELELIIHIKNSLLSRVFNVLFSVKKYSNTLIVPLDSVSKVSHIQGNLDSKM